MAAQENLKLALPTGELACDVNRFLKRAGLKFDVDARKYSAQVKNLPIELVYMRAGMIPETINDPNSDTRVGITGNDLIWNAGFGRDYGKELPLYKLVPDAKRWSLVVAITNSFAESIKREKSVPSLADLRGTILATERSVVAQDLLSEEAIEGVEVREVQGTAEAMPNVYPNCHSCLVILNSGKTLQVNGLEPIRIFYPGAIKLISSELGINGFSHSVLEKLQHMINSESDAIRN